MMELSVVFFYGADMKRTTDQKPTEKQTTFLSILYIFSFSMTIIVCWIRKKYRLRRNGLISAYIDILITFYGGGKLLLNHKFERLIFAILFVGFFFLNILYFQIVIYPLFLLRDQSIKNFEELSILNPPNYISPELKNNEKMIELLLRFVLLFFFL